VCAVCRRLPEADKLFEQDSGADHLSAEQEAAAVTDGINSRSSFLSQVDEILAECGTAYTAAAATAAAAVGGKKSSKTSSKQRGSEEKKSSSGVVGLQRALFSATIGPFVQELAASFLNNPVEVNIGVVNAGASSIDQRLVFVGREDGKLLAIRQLIQQGELKPPVLLFLQNKERAKELFRELVYEGINIDVIHGDRSQQQREDVIRKFRLGETWVLICTDLMARGIDFKGVKMVINYDLPQSGVAYIHRIGRTGRAGRQGEAVTLFTEKDIPSMRSIANVMKLSGCKVPDWLLAVKQVRYRDIYTLYFHMSSFLSELFATHFFYS
jgi:superfamily II DNA/RNA helicase